MKEKKIRVLILNADYDRDSATNGARILASHLRRSAEVMIVNAWQNKTMRKDGLRNFDRIIITGSRASVYNKRPWIKTLTGSIRDIDSLSIPTLGICFGFQAVCQAFGGRVESSGSFEEGYKRIELTPSGKRHWIMGPHRASKAMFYESHGDVAVILPRGAKILARNDFSVQAYSLRRFTCVQFHPEITASVAMRMAIRDRKNVDEMLNGVGKDFDMTLRLVDDFLHRKG